MRLALLLGSLGTGGAERQFSLLARGLAAAGHHVYFLTFSDGGGLSQEIEGVAGIERVVLAPGMSGMRSLLRARRSLPEWIRSAQVDVLYSALYHANWIAARPQVSSQLPVVWGIRTATQDWTRQQRLFMGLGRRHRNAVELAVSNSSAGIETHRRANYLPREVRWIPNAVDLNRFRPDETHRAAKRAELGVPADQILVAFVGRPMAVKGLDLFVRVAEAAPRSTPQLRFVAFVPDPSAVPADLRSECEKRNVRIASGAEIENCYPAMDVLLNTSRAEGFPNAIAEAMACGVPAVAHDVGDNARLVAEPGRVVAVGDADAMLAAIRVLQAEERERQVSRMRSQAQQQCSPEALVQSTVEALEFAIEQWSMRS